MNWQPIETAPKDGGIVLLYRPTAPDWGVVVPGKWNDDKYAKRPRPYWEGWLRIDCTTTSRMYQPTHWMPLPTVPNSDAAVQDVAKRDDRINK